MREELFSFARLAAALASLALASGASPAHGFTISAAGGDESHAYMATDEPLLPSIDTDYAVDIYVRSGAALSLATVGDPSCRPGCGNAEIDVDTTEGLHPLDGDGLVFSTAEPLVPADADTALDVYLRSGEGPELLSRGREGLSGPFDAEFNAASQDGSSVLFTTMEQLVEADTDSSADVYERSGGSTVLVSRGESFNGGFDAEWGASTPDQSAVFFLTAERLLTPDTDSSVDLYERRGATTSLISRGTVPANGEFDVTGPIMTSAAGLRTVFNTSEPIMEDDEDEEADVYMRFGGTTSLVSGGSYNPYAGEHPAELNALDPLANQVVFSSDQVLNLEDRDATGRDVFEWFYGKTILVSQGPFEPFNPPADTAEFLRYSPARLGIVLFSSTGRLVPADTDSSPDIYERELGAPKQTNPFERSEGTTKLVSQGPKGFNGAFEATLRQMTPDGSRVFFTTLEQLVNADTDNSVDLYEREGGAVTRLFSIGQVNGNGAFDVTAQGDGERPMFSTAEQLLPADQDDRPDLYERVGSVPRLLSTAKPDPPAPSLTSTDPASPSNVNTARIRGIAEAGSRVTIYAGSSCGGAPRASGTAAELAGQGLTVTVPDDVTSSFTARSTDANNNAGACSQALTYVEDSTAPRPALTQVQPAGPANENSPRLWGAAEAVAVVRIFTDSHCLGAPAAIGTGAELGGSGIAVPVADDSVTSFFADVTDRAGNVSECVGYPTYTEDSTAPDARIEAGPRARARSRTASFRFGASEPGAAFACKLDRRGLVPCAATLTFSRLARGRHRIWVVAADAAGNADPTPAIHTWRIVRKRRNFPRSRRRPH